MRAWELRDGCCNHRPAGGIRACPCSSSSPPVRPRRFSPNGDVYGGGTATTSWLINGETYTSLLDGVSAGWCAEDRIIFLTISQSAADTWRGAYVVVSPDLLVAGADIPLDGIQADALLI
ncbi:MAG: hypothetical protein EXR69_02440 [Myxococcales bacterium]|nr:hypothetical protein [Myxococcales bacterium]